MHKGQSMEGTTTEKFYESRRLDFVRHKMNDEYLGGENRHKFNEERM